MRPAVGDRLVLFGPQHLVLLAIFAVGCIVVVFVGNWLRARPELETRTLRIAGALMLIVCGPFELYDLVIGVQHPRSSLPLQICDFAWFVAGVALITRGPRWSAILYFWGLTLCVQGVITPDLDHVFPQLQFFGFWVRHIAPVWAAVYLIGARAGPSWRGYRFVVVVTAVWAALMLCLNGLLGSNYGYLNGKPVSHSALDLLGPWPWYVVVEFALVAGVWALISWPWNRRARRTNVPE